MTAVASYLSQVPLSCFLSVLVSGEALQSQCGRGGSLPVRATPARTEGVGITQGRPFGVRLSPVGHVTITHLWAKFVYF